MSLKENLRRRAEGMKVEGPWRLKLLVYGGAAAVMGLILLVMFLLLGSWGTGDPQVGTVVLKSQGQEYTPLSNQIYVTQGGQRQEGRRLVPAEVGDSAPTVVFDHSLTIGYTGKSANGGFAFTIYDEEGRVYTQRLSSAFVCPREPGRYLVCEECYWGGKRENIGMEYYFWIEVTEEYLAQREE